MSTDADQQPAEYHLLTNQQQAIVDVCAADRLTDGQSQLTELQEQIRKQYDVSVPHESTISEVRSDYRDTIRERSQVFANGSNGDTPVGDITVEGELDLTNGPGETHLAEVVSDSGTDTACPHCGEEFGTERALNAHVPQCSANSREWQCDHCGETFQTAGSLGGHTQNCPARDANVSVTPAAGTSANGESTTGPDSRSSQSPAQRLKTAAAAIDDIRLGDIDSDSIDDVFALQSELKAFAKRLSSDGGEQA